ncbi:MAG: tetratricopeptide repeat protein [Magnetococcales bacterium]|nr:tetratricopeptide repeat protein [Magnetococcales bacterium]
MAKILFCIIISLIWAVDVRSDPRASEAIFAYAADLENKNDHPRAATEFGRYVFLARQGSREDFVRLEEAMYRHAVNLAHAKETDAALRAFSELGAAYPKSPLIPQALFQMGQVYERSGAVGEAKQRYQRLAGMGMDTEFSALSRLRLAWLALRRPGEETKAREHLQAVTHPKYADQAKGMLKGVEALPNLPYKTPWLAGTMSAVLPGAGHLYAERPRDAGFAFLSNGLLLAGTVQAFSKGITGLGAALSAVELGWYSGTIFSAVNLTHKYNQRLREDHLGNVAGSLPRGDNAVGVEMEWRY